MKYMGRAARMQRHHKRHKGAAAVINLVSMIDMLTVLVFFLLVYSTEVVEVLPSTKEVQLPESTAEAKFHTAVVVIVTEHDILIKGKSVGKIDDVIASDGVLIPALKSALEAEADGMLRQPGLTEEERIAKREVTIIADKELPFKLLKKVMATSTAASYGQLSLAVLQKASDLAVASVASN
ncbi:MAG TPA: biopolymer transporter ExbD [Gammaproteobacteria bacterium]|jgi:biopolymer transport protein ExbD|nr:biopolymer transporter ExbD [Gammaproteobacteria bacterium]